MKAYPRTFLAWFWSLLALIAITGLVLLPGMLALRLEWDVPDRWLPPARVTWAAAHGLLAFLTLMLFGSLLPLHVRHGLRQRKNRGTGIALCTLGALVVLSGYLLYYFAPDTLRPALGWTHSGVGVAMVVLAAFHQRRRPARPAAWG